MKLYIHFSTQQEAEKPPCVPIKEQFLFWKLELHPDKTRIIYCKDNKRKGNHPNTNFDFLRYEFRARSCKIKFGKMLIGFTPAIRPKTMNRVAQEIKELGVAAKIINPKVRGWLQYYGTFRKSSLYKLERVVSYRN